MNTVKHSHSTSQMAILKLQGRTTLTKRKRIIIKISLYVFFNHGFSCLPLGVATTLKVSFMMNHLNRATQIQKLYYRLRGASFFQTNIKKQTAP